LKCTLLVMAGDAANYPAFKDHLSGRLLWIVEVEWSGLTAHTENLWVRSKLRIRSIH